MVVFFSSSFVILAAIIVVLLVLSAVGMAERTFDEILRNYSLEIILVLSLLAFVIWMFVTCSKAKEKGYPKKKYSIISSLLFGASSGISLYSCIFIIGKAISVFMSGIDKDGLLFLFTALYWFFKAILYLLLCVPVGGLGMGIPFYAIETAKKENGAYKAGVAVLISQIIILAMIFFV